MNRHSRPASTTVQVTYTRDAKAPLVADDWDMDCGWQNIPLPPTLDDDWIIWDNTKDRRTGWIRASALSHREWGSA